MVDITGRLLNVKDIVVAVRDEAQPLFDVVELYSEDEDTSKTMTFYFERQGKWTTVMLPPGLWAEPEVRQKAISKANAALPLVSSY